MKNLDDKYEIYEFGCIDIDTSVNSHINEGNISDVMILPRSILIQLLVNLGTFK